MAPRFNLKHDEETRAKIQTSQLINRLQKLANGEVEMTQTQLKAAEILLKKSLPDLANVQVSGDPNKPVSMLLGWMTNPSGS